MRLHGLNAESSEFICAPGSLVRHPACTGVLVCTGWPGRESGEVKLVPCSPFLVLGSIGVRQIGLRGRFSFSIGASTCADHVSSG